MMKYDIITSEHENQHQAGFTLIELSMSLVFIAFIILFLVMTMLSIMQTYNKGIWLNQINLAGRQINADIGDQVRFSTNAVTVNQGMQRLCIGGVTYLWNTKDSYQNRYSEEATNTIVNKTTKLRFARVLDGSGKYCTDSSAMPSRNDSGTSALLGPGAIIQEFSVVKNDVTGLLRIQAVFSTEGDDQPRKVDTDPNVDSNGDGNKTNDQDRWQCGQVIGGTFKVTSNQFCSFAEFDIITYRRLGE